jgi:hypothetical protein
MSLNGLGIFIYDMARFATKPLVTKIIQNFCLFFKARAVVNKCWLSLTQHGMPYNYSTLRGLLMWVLAWNLADISYVFFT